MPGQALEYADAGAAWNASAGEAHFKNVDRDERLAMVIIIICGGEGRGRAAVIAHGTDKGRVEHVGVV